MSDTADGMRRYLVLMHGDEQAWSTYTEAERQAEMERHIAFPDVCADHGVAISGSEALEPTSTATTFRRRGDDVTVIDGPYAETAEQLGGFYLLDAADLDTVLKVIAQLPEYTFEVRPVDPNPGES